VETFIVRVYRKDPLQDDITGLVETIGSDEVRPFRSIADLVSVIRDVCNDSEQSPDRY
jgi:hypothetical protein